LRLGTNDAPLSSSNDLSGCDAPFSPDRSGPSQMMPCKSPQSTRFPKCFTHLVAEVKAAARLGGNKVITSDGEDIKKIFDVMLDARGGDARYMKKTNSNNLVFLTDSVQTRHHTQRKMNAMNTDQPSSKLAFLRASS
jgi:hypothetical protein